MDGLPYYDSDKGEDSFRHFLGCSSVSEMVQTSILKRMEELQPIKSA